MRVLISPDSFKGSASAVEVTRALADGWRAVRPDDELLLIPLADGGEGTLDALELGIAGSVRVPLGTLTGPDLRPVDGEALRGPDGTYYLEMAQVSGLPLMARPDAMNATSRGVGEALAGCLRRGATRIVLGVGGSASTDGGAGALAALGARLMDAQGRQLPDGGGALRDLVSIDVTPVLAPPSGGLTILTDVDNPLLGPHGAAAVYGPQKGADPEQVVLLDAGLATLVRLLGGTHDAAGAGAAGGIVYGLQTAWGARMRRGCPEVMAVTRFDEALAGVDVVITGEGRFDATSLRGKVVGEVLTRAGARGVTTLVVAGSAGSDVDISDLDGPARAPDAVVELVTVAGGLTAALAQPTTHLRTAARLLATSFRGRT